PGYYQNPAAFTYLLFVVLRVLYGPLGFLFDLDWGNVTDQFTKDPGEIWVVARTVAAVLGVAGAGAAYWAARRIWGVREALVAAAIVAFAFLPVAYSRIAVTDVGALIGVGLSLMWSVRAYEDGRLRDFALGGAAAGLALSFKYTAGLALLPLGIAALARLRADGPRPLLGLGAGVGLAAVVFVVLNPYLLGSFDEFWTDLREQAEVAADEPKPGQQSGGVAYYLDSLTWGLGWAAALAALAGAVLELRRDLVRGLILVALPLALFAYLALQSRYFGRWLLPAYPALAMLAAVALVRLADLVPPRRLARTAVLVGVTLLVLAQPLAADVRTALVLGRDDTREQARDFLVDRFAPALRVSIEPAVPGRWFRTNPEGRFPSWLRRCPKDDRWRLPGGDDWPRPGYAYPGPGGERICARFLPGQFTRPDGGVRASAYHLVLAPEVIDDLRFYGYCHVVTFGTVRERVAVARDPRATAYYERLEREADVLRRFSPYDEGAEPEPFHFDHSFSYYPAAYHRPGPVTTIYRLRDCDQAYGAPVIQIPRARELAPFAPRRYRPGTEEDQL
ncbi:MAG TPA: glycosyltransferase family 39 protein, partial [Thermoleophilaceae bacterium]|nr:glycosyltransferase family 39 protein [Thermoleophilaceae bacterium]